MTGRLYLAGGTAIGVYLGAVGLDVYRASGEERGLRATIAAEQHEAASCERAAEREETAVASFQEAVEQQQQAVASLDAQISELQALREAKLKETADAVAALEESRLKLAKLVQESKRHKEAASTAGQALAEAHQKAQEAKLGINPLHHPLVRAFRRVV